MIGEGGSEQRTRRQGDRKECHVIEGHSSRTMRARLRGNMDMTATDVSYFDFAACKGKFHICRLVFCMD